MTIISLVVATKLFVVYSPSFSLLISSHPTNLSFGVEIQDEIFKQSGIKFFVSGGW